MTLRRLVFTLTPLLLLCLSATPALAEEVTEAWRGGGFSNPQSVSVNPTDNSCWVADTWKFQVVHLSENGSELWRGGVFGTPSCLSVNSADGSCWVADDYSGEVVHLAENGTELWRGGGFYSLKSVSVNASDGSCWVADYGNGQILHLDADGAELWQSGDFIAPGSLSVNPTDGSCWVAEADGQLVHLAEDGTEVWREGGFYQLGSVSVNPTDGSCWVADTYAGQVAHIAQDGTELCRIDGFLEPRAVSVNSADGSCWVADSSNNRIVHLAEDGTELWVGDGGFYQPRSLSANSADGSCWVADTHHHQVVHLVIPGWRPPVFYDVPPYSWTFEQVEACVSAGIVSGYPDGLYHPDGSVSRDQMAVFISRALAGGDDNVPDGPPEATFDDVPTDHWAYDYVEYCVAEDIVQGFDRDTYGPDMTVERDAMAVFIARAVAGGDPNVPDGPDTATFDDVPTDHWAYKYIEYCAAESIVQGYDPLTYGPTVTVSRDQMAVFISRAFILL